MVRCVSPRALAAHLLLYFLFPSADLALAAGMIGERYGHHTTFTSTLTTTVTTMTSTITLGTPGHKSTTTETATSTVTLVPAPSTSASLATEALSSTNYYRAQHQARPLSWNTTLASYAQNYAEACVWAHSVSFSSIPSHRT
ncbi:hypothetical protein BAUCODRAFT_39691 [Baudoinia panamericana UAMH 10762]|uniref:SCP domain-containing protein n=1 Tax=Baudoinia panamericana (strain UAMH 10762) TaxID=717646 RepID=M2MJN1_BAUPA|nr:uncharacterized protein BAUCODRAFT_39691 [Baudoinia panamericana UAMH 10762]EMC91508.1 hypothetical protein BAUCODRAFT_39691 [Baudoinia panamericana UAMH 10762]